MVKIEIIADVVRLARATNILIGGMHNVELIAKVVDEVILH